MEESKDQSCGLGIGLEPKPPLIGPKIIDYEIAEDVLLPNLLAFNVGVEIGQLIALAMILIVMGYWRKTASFWKHAYTANVVMMSAGFILVGYQMTGYFVS